ncbi:MAG: hypothetical protein JRG76_07240 [Deltaproteobacteria bacterium]|nr:hypothetical protein [Deltaproteobacteria bacterium]MBW2414288.1 hypothetical protein [Deltaproteobacteria bacterium]
MRSTTRPRWAAIACTLALAACAGQSGPDRPPPPLYPPPSTLDIRVGIRSDNSLPSQLYGGAVIDDLKEMRLFSELISPYNKAAGMDVKVRLFIERTETDDVDRFVIGLVPTGRPIAGAFASPDPLISTSLPVGPDVGSGIMGTLEASSPGSVHFHARKLANALAEKIWQERETLLPKLRAAEDGGKD